MRGMADPLIPARIRQFLKDRDVTVLQLASNTGFDPDMVQKWANGEATPTAIQLATVGRFLGQKASDFTSERPGPYDLELHTVALLEAVKAAAKKNKKRKRK